jgi:D-alanine-D-alanine ligase
MVWTSRESELGIMEEVQAVRASMDRLRISHLTVGLRDLADLPAVLYRHPAHIAVNLVEGFQHTPDDMSLVPAVCRAFGVEVTGSDTPCISLALDKWKTNRILAAHGIRCPHGVLIPVGQILPAPHSLSGQCIVKPAASDASEGIDSHSVVDADDPTLHDLIRHIHEKFNQPALVEPMIGQRELNVSILQIGRSVEVLPLAEIDFSAFAPSHPKIVGYAAKWIPDSFEYNHTPRIIPAPVSMEQAVEIRRIAQLAWQAIGCRDYARVDIRLDDCGQPVVLEVNPNPDISPDAGFAAALGAAGYSYDRFIRILLDNAAARHPPIHSGTSGGQRQAFRQPSQVSVRYVTSNDREPVLSLLAQPKFFRPDEIRVGQEVLDDSIRDGAEGHYQSFVIETSGRVAGWLCFGPTPCTEKTYDIYWIVVAADFQRQGLGKALMAFAEARIHERGGRMAVVETSGREDYVSTRKFYLRIGYHEAARVRDFYAPGDDKIISVKML